jgi:hypothetical protein
METYAFNMEHRWCLVSTPGERWEDRATGEQHTEAEGKEQITWGGQW